MTALVARSHSFLRFIFNLSSRSLHSFLSSILYLQLNYCNSSPSTLLCICFFRPRQVNNIASLCGTTGLHLKVHNDSALCPHLNFQDVFNQAHPFVGHPCVQCLCGARISSRCNDDHGDTSACRLLFCRCRRSRFILQEGRLWWASSYRYIHQFRNCYGDRFPELLLPSPNLQWIIYRWTHWHRLRAQHWISP